MPFRPRRKQYRKRGPRKMAARRPYVARNRRINTKGVHYFKRSFYVSSDLLSTGGVSLNFAKSYNLNQLPGSTEFSNLFDQYRINLIKVRWMPRANSAELFANNTIGSLFSVIDYDDATSPGGINELMQYQNLKTTRHVAQHVRVFKPKFNTPVGVTGSRAINGWLDMNDTTVAHHGLKGHLQGNGNPGVTVIYDCIVTMYVACKNVR